MLQACLNGGRDRAFHPATPLSPNDLAADAKAVVEAGAQQLHIHVRDAAGMESLHPDDVARALEAVRASVPGIPVGLSTGWWILPKGRARQQHIRAMAGLPDYVSINLIEEDSAEMIDLVLEKGIGVEAGLWSAPTPKVPRPPQRRKMPAGFDRAQRTGTAGGGTSASRHSENSRPRRHAAAAAAARPRSHGLAALPRNAAARGRRQDRARGRQAPALRRPRRKQCCPDPRGACACPRNLLSSSQRAA